MSGESTTRIMCGKTNILMRPTTTSKECEILNQNILRRMMMRMMRIMMMMTMTTMGYSLLASHARNYWHVITVHSTPKVKGVGEIGFG